MRGGDIIIIVILGLGGLYFVELIYEEEEDDSLSYITIAMNESSKGNEDAKMDWMYRDSSQIVDKEEYLLGRKVDKQFEKNMLPTDKDRGCLPSLFSNSESQVDVVRKLQEDPLYLIKKKEIESREQLLKNPRKMKQLQEMIAKQQALADKRKRKEIKRKKKMQLDTLLVKKCKKLFGTVDIKKLEALSSMSESSSEDNDNESNKDIKSLDEQIAAKYKKLLGNMDAKRLAEMDSSGDSDHSHIEVDQRTQSRSTKHKEIKANPSTHDYDGREHGESRHRNSKNTQDKTSSDNERLLRKEKFYSTDKLSNKNYSDKREKRNAKYESQDSERISRSFERRISTSESSECSRNDRYNSKQDSRDKLRSKDKSHSSKIYYEKSDKNYLKYKLNAPKSKLKSSERRKSSSECSSQSSSNESCSANVGREKLSSRDKRNTSKVKANSGEGSENYLKQEFNRIKKKSKKSKRNKSSSESDDDRGNDRRNSKTKNWKKTKEKYRADIAEDPPHVKGVVRKQKKKEIKSNYRSSSNSESSSEHSGPSRKSQQGKQYGLVLPANYVPKEKPKEGKLPKGDDDKDKIPVKVEPKRKLTEKEKEQRLKEMMSNAKWREELRDKNIKAHNEKMKSEKDDYVYNEDFMRKQMALAVSQGTVESRVKANINSIQRSGSSMNEHFARRH